ncbi:MAG: response regulator [Rhodopila sp.]
MVADADARATILVVDDDAELRLFLVDLLREEYTVLEAESADAAVALLSNTSVDFVLSDVRMPGTMDGFGLAAWLRTNRPSTPMLLMSGYSGLFTPQRPDDPPLWRKPFPFSHLLAHIQHVLHPEPCCRV